MEKAVGRDHGTRLHGGSPANAAEELSANKDGKLDRIIGNQNHERLLGLMDGEYLDYNVLAKSAVADVKSLDRKDPRFLQMMKVKLQTHSTNLEEDKMGHRITSDEMVREHWIPLLTDLAREDWLKMPTESHLYGLISRNSWKYSHWHAENERV